jgi:hypothetical protein
MFVILLLEINGYVCIEIGCIPATVKMKQIMLYILSHI